MNATVICHMRQWVRMWAAGREKLCFNVSNLLSHLGPFVYVGATPIISSLYSANSIRLDFNVSVVLWIS